jgi:CheY-like chemotaxis protein
MKWILVVEDDADNRDTILDLLDDAGYAVKGAEDSAAGLTLMQGPDQPCLVVADLVMSGIDGKDMQREARRRLGDRVPPFLFITGNNPADVEDISGAFLHKPIDIEQLLAAIVQRCGPAGSASVA